MSAGERMQTAESLVSQFANLHEGPRVFHHVVRLGDAAVPALERFARGPSQGIYQTRSLAVDALASIGTATAAQSLTHALRDSIMRDLDPVSLEAESVLVNHIAEHLSRFPTPDVIDALLAALQQRPYPYCAAALGLIGGSQAIPSLVDCLFDDPARPAAASALRRFGCAALPRLVAALERKTNSGTESPTRALGRAVAARLIGECAGSEADGVPAILTRALHDPERAVRWESAIALARNPGSYAEETTEVLAGALDDPDWGRAQTTAEALAQLPNAGARIVKLIGGRARTDADQRRRLRAVALAGQIRLPAALPGLRALSTAADPKLRLAAVWALGQIEAATPESIARFLTDREPVIRRRALQALRRRHALTSESATAFLGDEDPDVRRLADASVCEDLYTAWPALHRAVFHFGAPRRGFASRLRLWRRACVLLLERRIRQR